MKITELNYKLDEDVEGQIAARAKFIKDKFGSQWHGVSGYEDIDKFIEKLIQVDPSLKKIYIPWMARLIITKPTENRAEDLDRVGQDLQAFEANKAKIANKDINSYKSFQDLFDVIAPFLAPKKKTKDELAKEKEKAALEKVKADIITVYQGPEGWIRIPTTQAAATFLGQGTRWCTAAQKNNMFSHYAKDDNLFVVYDKTSKERFQLHIQSGQFASEDDRNEGLGAVPEWAGKIILDYYQKHNPKLTMKQLMALQGFTKDNLAAGTEHEGLFDLFKQYGI